MVLLHVVVVAVVQSRRKTTLWGSSQHGSITTPPELLLLLLSSSVATIMLALYKRAPSYTINIKPKTPQVTAKEEIKGRGNYFALNSISYQSLTHISSLPHFKTFMWLPFSQIYSRFITFLYVQQQKLFQMVPSGNYKKLYLRTIHLLQQSQIRLFRYPSMHYQNSPINYSS